jgi:hypothetical protein
MSAPAHLPDRVPQASSPPWPRLPLTFVAWAAVLVAVAGAAGFLGRALTTPEPAAPAASRVVDLGPVALSAPGAWTPDRRPVAGLPAELGGTARAFAPVPGLSTRAVVALAPFDDPSLVPAPLRALAGAGAARRTRLAGLPAWTYPPSELAKGRMAQVTVAPTSAGSVTLVCLAPTTTWSGGGACSDGLAGATLQGTTPLAPSPTLAFRRELGPVLDRLNDRRGGLRKRLRGAPSRRAQARFAGRLATVHTRALAALTPAAPPAGAPRKVLRELRRSGRSYRRLAVAARNGRPARYRRARLAVRRSDRALAAAVAAVR